MKKISSFLTILFAVSFAAHAQTVGSANIMGYTKVEKPGSSKLNMIGICFVTTNQTLNTLIDPLGFSGHHAEASAADHIIIWNADDQEYTTYALYDVRAFEQTPGEYDYLTGWKSFNGFGGGAAYTNPVLSEGSAVWVRGSTASNEVILLSGNVSSSAAITNNILSSLQLISNPFSDARNLADFTLHENATGHHAEASAADQIIIWNPDTQAYTTYALYDVRAFEQTPGEYDYLTGWKAFDGFGGGADYADVEVAVGEGFWFRAVNGPFNWVETNRYISAFN